jgi:hypothetical protein
MWHSLTIVVILYNEAGIPYSKYSVPTDKCCDMILSDENPIATATGFCFSSIYKLLKCHKKAQQFLCDYHIPHIAELIPGKGGTINYQPDPVMGRIS